MNRVKDDLQSIAKNLKELAQRTEKMAKQINKAGRGPAREKAPAKTREQRAPRRGGRVTAIDTVFEVIGKSKKGADTSTIKQKTGFEERKIWDIINKLKKQDKIKSVRKGLYIKS